MGMGGTSMIYFQIALGSFIGSLLYRIFENWWDSK